MEVVMSEAADRTLETTTARSVFATLKLVFGIVPIVAGLDKFTNLLVDWSKYIAPAFASMLPFSGRTFMYIVGVIEIVAGLGVLATRWTRSEDAPFLAGQARPRSRNRGYPRQLAHDAEEPGPIPVHLAHLLALAQRERGSGSLRLGDLRRERRGSVHAQKGYQEPALVHHRHRDADADFLGLGLRRGDGAE